jgi:predicted membrane metal-binding protein
VHLTLGILRQSQAVFYALAFFWLDGFAVPAPAQVTQTVVPLSAKLSKKKGKNYECYLGHLD